MQVDAENRGTGEAYVEFVRPDDAEKALYKNRQMMGHRYCVCVCVCVCYTALCTGTDYLWTFPSCWSWACDVVRLLANRFDCGLVHSVACRVQTHP